MSARAAEAGASTSRTRCWCGWGGTCSSRRGDCRWWGPVRDALPGKSRPRSATQPSFDPRTVQRDLHPDSCRPTHCCGFMPTVFSTARAGGARNPMPRRALLGKPPCPGSNTVTRTCFLGLNSLRLFGLRRVPAVAADRGPAAGAAGCVPLRRTILPSATHSLKSSTLAPAPRVWLAERSHTSARGAGSPAVECGPSMSGATTQGLLEISVHCSRALSWSRTPSRGSCPDAGEASRP